MTPFHLSVSEEDLTDLYHRLDRVILPTQTLGPDWSRGIPPAMLRMLLDRWRDGYDWRGAERTLNKEDQHLVDVDGVRIHFARRAGSDRSSLPLLATHGWPYTYAQMLPLADALGGKVPVVAPSLPGFIHSDPFPVPFNARSVAERWHRLMTEVLGYDRYLVYGEDIGAPVTDWLAGMYPDQVAGIITTHPSYSAKSRPGVKLDATEHAYFARQNRFDETGYAHQQATRPDTLAVALLDSPAGLLAWIAEKIAAWSDGGAESGFSDLATDEVLTLVSLFWFTGSIGTSFRSYCEGADFDDHPVIDVPASIVIQTHERDYPRSLAEKSYRDIRNFTRLEAGGHFTAWENPVAVADAIRDLVDEVR